MDSDALDAALLKAHAAGDLEALIRLYTQAGDAAEARGDTEEACFFLTHAFVFALELGSTDAKPLNARLAENGRAHLIDF